MNYFIIVYAIAFLVTSCSEQSIHGKWKLREVDLMDVPSQKKRITLDLTKPDKMKTELYEESIPEELRAKSLNTSNKETGGLDTISGADKIKADIEKWVTAALQTSMTLERDNRFNMKSNGLIVPTVTAGWHFGDSLQGNWATHKDTLVLSIGNDTQSYTWKYKIIQLTKKDLKLQELFDGFEGRGNELRFARE